MNHRKTVPPRARLTGQHHVTKQPGQIAIKYCGSEAYTQNPHAGASAAPGVKTAGPNGHPYDGNEASIVKIELPEPVREIIHILEQAGYEAFAVGGCVRDSLLHRIPNDWDITTSARPAQVKELFRRTVDTGIAHGTVTVMMGQDGYEVTTYRLDGEYEDSRHPKEVTFTASLTEDLKRRDFTINAMAYSETRGLVDEFGGVQDLEYGLIRCVGDADERFLEDALRILRAVRFSSQLGYSIEEKTGEAISRLAGRLKNISAERIMAELTKLLLSPHPDYLKIAWETGITSAILPEFDRIMDLPQNNPHHFTTVGEHTLLAVKAVPAQRVLRFTMLFHDMGKPACQSVDENGTDHFYGHAQESSKLARAILKRLKSDRELMDQVSLLTAWHDVKIEPGKKAVRRALSKLGKENFPLLMQIKYADLEGQSSYEKVEKQKYLTDLEFIYREILKDGDCLTVRDLAVNGRDLIGEGMQPGPALGAVLDTMLQDVLENPGHNTREYLLENLPKET